MTTLSIRQEFADDHITREAGERLRRRILELSRPGETLRIDFSEVVIASTSFLDEGLAKLASEGWSAERVERSLELAGMNPRDRALLEKLSVDRWGKSGAPRWRSAS